MKNNRIATGIDGLDEIMHGGFLPASSYLVVGGPGTGKTILALQTFNEAVKRGARCLYFTFAEPEETIRKNAAAFGWDLAGVTFVDFTGDGQGDTLNGEYSVFPPAEVEKEPVWQRIYQALEEHQPDRVAIDSATFLHYLSTDPYQYRKQTQKLINRLGTRGCISLFLYEPEELRKDVALSLAVDGVLSIRNTISEAKITEIRTLEIQKMRGSSFLSGRHPLRITSRGITLWPHRIERMKSIDFARKKICSGIEGLDDLLHGGISSGTCTLITGPSGVGKSTLGAQFLTVAARTGSKAALYTFEEGTASILNRCNGVGINLEREIEQKNILAREVNPLELYPDEFLEIIRNDVEVNGVDVVMLDSLRGYNLVMAEFGNLVANMQNLITFLRGRKVTIFLISEVEKLTGEVMITDLGVSYLSDNVLMLRYAEFNGAIIKVISCLKKRLTDFEPELRELKITGQGILIGERLEHLRGLLTGVPQADTEHEKPTM